jgi:hypothetical protein
MKNVTAKAQLALLRTATRSIIGRLLHQTIVAARQH